MSTIEVDGLRIAYERAGQGPPLVLLHGYVGEGPATWRPQLDGLSDEFTVIAWDAPGAGASSDPPDPFGMAGYADCLAGFIDALGLERPHVAGLSFGGALALALEGRHPAVAGSLVLASAYAGWAGSLSPEVTQQRLAQAMVLADLSPEDVRRHPAAHDVLRSDAASVGRRVRRQHGAVPPGRLPGHGRASAEDLRDVLPHVDVPTLLVYGDRDVRAPLSVAEHLHAEIAGSTLVVLPGVGHVCNLESRSSSTRPSAASSPGGPMTSVYASDGPVAPWPSRSSSIITARTSSGCRPAGRTGTGRGPSPPVARQHGEAVAVHPDHLRVPVSGRPPNVWQ